MRGPPRINESSGRNACWHYNSETVENETVCAKLVHNFKNSSVVLGVIVTGLHKVTSVTSRVRIRLIDSATGVFRVERADMRVYD